MEVILLKDVEHLGTLGDLVKVRPGYARNFLLPQRLALVASVQNQRRLQHEQKIIGYQKAKVQDAAEKQAKSLASMTITIARKVGEQEKLFGSVTAQDIVEALAEKGIEIERKKCQLAEPIKSLGTFTVQLRLPANVKASIQVQVVPEASA